jgi:hypothetical protein
MSERRFFHGGAPGLKVGDILSPRPADDQRHLVDGCGICEARRRGAPSDYDRDHNFAAVYVTTDRQVARFFANGYPHGGVYRVEPLGELTTDPEQPPWAIDEPVSFAVPQARVLAVLDPLVRVTAKEARRMMRRLGVTERGVLAAVSA